ncbi:MAG: ssDNA endonuclease and repair protein rad10 [Peltula sp. TS41687]|nr:MAG: ssDNA endonuclease and repair protein rad10 [Peltula sp. TS41687]
MDDDFEDDAELAAVLHQVEHSRDQGQGAPAAGSTTASSSTNPKVQQPKPQALPSRKGPSSILVSPRQKGNPILNSIHSVPWEYSDIPADYLVGATTCVLFLSLKYHRLHPEYIYTRIRALQGKYKLRVLLTMVDIENHEDPLRELSKTSLINNLTLLLCWSAAEAGRYLSLLKTYEHASPSSIRGQQSTSYNERLVEFVTTPRSINKTDAVSLVGNFGSIRAAINASPEEISMVGGWGEKKVNNWCTSVREGFRVGKAKRRGLGMSREQTRDGLGEAVDPDEEDDQVTTPRLSGLLGVGAPVPISMVPSREVTRGEGESPARISDADRRPPKRLAEEITMWEPGQDDEEAMIAAAEAEEMQVAGKAKAPGTENPRPQHTKTRPGDQDGMSDGIMAALEKLREKGS